MNMENCPLSEFCHILFLPGNLGVQESYQEIQEFSKILVGVSGIQDSWQGIHGFPGSQTLGMLVRRNRNFSEHNWVYYLRMYVHVLVDMRVKSITSKKGK